MAEDVSISFPAGRVGEGVTERECVVRLSVVITLSHPALPCHQVVAEQDGEQNREPGNQREHFLLIELTPDEQEVLNGTLKRHERRDR